MAQKSTIFKAALNVADMDHQVYGDFSLTIARHPSETDERMMLRVLAFALHAHERLEFGRGISTDDEPDLWRKSLTGDIEQWIDLGTPEPSRLRKACGRAESVILYAYGARAVPVWWEKSAPELARFANLEVFSVDGDTCQALAAMAGPNMEFQCTIQDAESWLSSAGESVRVKPQRLEH
jgi:uncharacterized protein YaeQ